MMSQRSVPSCQRTPPVDTARPRRLNATAARAPAASAEIRNTVAAALPTHHQVSAAMTNSRTNRTTWPTAGPCARSQVNPEKTIRPPATKHSPTSAHGQDVARPPAVASQTRETIQRANPASMLAIGTRNLLSTVRLLGQSGMHGHLAEAPAFTTTGSLPFQSSHALGSVANSHMECATFAMLVLSGLKRLLTSPSCNAYSETSPSRSVSGRTAAH